MGGHQEAYYREVVCGDPFAVEYIQKFTAIRGNTCISDQNKGLCEPHLLVFSTDHVADEFLNTQ